MLSCSLDVYDKLPISHQLHDGKRRTEDVLTSNNSKFTSLPLEPQIQDGLAKCGFVYLSPIQKNALPLSLTGTSIIVHAKSGTGKTLVYVLTALNNFLKRKQKFVGCLILTPTREIAKQTYDVIKNVARFIEDLKIEYFIGGTPVDIDVVKSRNCHIAVGAPGRIKHLIELGSLRLDTIEILVLDEVDALLDQKEFAISKLISYLPNNKQTVVCTATFSRRILNLLVPICPDVEYLTVNKEMESASVSALTMHTTGIEDGRISCDMSTILVGVKQYVATVFKDSSMLDAIRKRDKLIEILHNFEYDQCFVFVNYVSSVKSIFNLLAKNDFEVSWISSEQIQSERLNAINQLKLNRIRILVSTDVASRGIDVQNVNLVINLGIPYPSNVYIHRMGRAGRYGSEGAVVTIVHEGDEMEELKSLLSVVCTEPVDLIMLPKQVTQNLLSDELEVIACQPYDIYDHKHELEEHYRTSGERQKSSSVSNNVGARRKKKKQKQKKTNKIINGYPNLERNNTVLQEGTTNASSLSPLKKFLTITDINSSFCEKDSNASFDLDSSKARTSSECSCPRLSEHEELEMISRYGTSLRTKLDRQSVNVDTSFLQSTFATQDTELKQKHEPQRRSEKTLTEYEDNDDDSIIRYALRVIEKNAFLDGQRFVCDIDELARIGSKNVFAGRVAGDVIRDTICKIRQLELPKLSSFSPVALHDDFDIDSDDPVPLSTSKRTRKKNCNDYNLSEELYGTFEKANENLKNQSNTNEEVNARTEIVSDCSKTTSKNWSCFNIENNSVFPSCSRASVACAISNANDEMVHAPPITATTGTGVAATERADGAITQFTTPCRYSTIPLPSLRIFVDQVAERRIWGHHLNFINEYVRRAASKSNFIL